MNDKNSNKMSDRMNDKVSDRMNDEENDKMSDRMDDKKGTAKRLLLVGWKRHDMMPAWLLMVLKHWPLDT